MLLALTACSFGLEPYAEDPGSTDAPGRRDPPVLVPLDPYRNQTSAVISGLAAAGTRSVRLVVEDSAGSTEHPVDVVDGAFSLELTLTRGELASIVAVDDNGSSEPVSTEVCDPFDSYELERPQEGQSCETALPVAEALRDAEDIVVVVGNALVEGDRDFYRVLTVDEAVVENNAGFENYRFMARLVSGGGSYAIQVFKEACREQECPGQEDITLYEDFAEDVEPDDLGELPADSRACGDAPLNPCEDYSATYTVLVTRTDGALDCTPYVLELSNGVW